MTQKLFVIFGGLAILILGAAFYWFQFRPSQIRKVCSWVARHEDAFPGGPDFGKNDPPPTSTIAKPMNEGEDGTVSRGYVSLFAGYAEKNKYEEAHRPPRPAKDWYQKATPSEYAFCLHSNGL